MIEGITFNNNFYEVRNLQITENGRGGA